MKITKDDLNQRLLMVETLLGLHRTLPSQVSHKQANDAIFRMQCALSSGKELVEREQKKLKQLDQSVFDGLDDKWQWATMSSVGIPFVYSYKPAGNRAWFSDSTTQEMIDAGRVMRIDKHGYDTSNWQNSLIEREGVELTGSDLCRAMLERGDRFVMCSCADRLKTDGSYLGSYTAVISGYSSLGFDVAHTPNQFRYVTPINNQGEPLTATDVGL